jgi:hypothetical protein
LHGLGISKLHGWCDARRFVPGITDEDPEMTHALQQFSALALIALVGPPVVAWLAPSTAIGRLSARLRDGLFRLLA